MDRRKDNYIPPTGEPDLSIKDPDCSVYQSPEMFSAIKHIAKNGPSKEKSAQLDDCLASAYPVQVDEYSEEDEIRRIGEGFTIIPLTWTEPEKSKKKELSSTFRRHPTKSKGIK